MTSDHDPIGPPGVFPADRLGAPVRFYYPGPIVWGRGVLIGLSDTHAYVHVASKTDSPPTENRREHVALDLSGSLDFGTRLLWELLCLGEQPPVAPEWERVWSGWRLRSGDVVFIVTAIPKGAWGEGAMHHQPTAAEKDPRRALAILLAHVVETRSKR